MSYYKSFAIVGFGEVGSMILEEFVKDETEHRRGYKLRVLTRESSKDKPDLAAFAAKGVEIIGVDYSSSASITRALQGVDVVLSTLRDDGLDLQTKVIHAAKAAGVKLFAPSEYGIDTVGINHEYLKTKPEAQDLLKKLDLPYVLFITGIFPEMFFPDRIGPHMGVDFKAGNFELFGDGNVAISWTSPRSIATYVHHVLTTLTASELKNRVIKIEGDRKTWREIVKIWETKHNKKAHIRYRTEEEAHNFQAAQTNILLVFCVDVLSNGVLGRAVTGGGENALWPDWNPLKWEDVVY